MGGRKGVKQKKEKDNQQELHEQGTRVKPLRFGKMEFYVGARLEALENKRWYPAKVVKVSEKDRKVLIHFEGWNQRYDCWLPIHSPKLKASTKAAPKVSVEEDIERDYQTGDFVLARWANGRHYPAKIMQSIGEGNYDVLFFDGFRKVVSKTNIKLDKKKSFKEFENKGIQQHTTTAPVTKIVTGPDTSSFKDNGGSSRHRKPVAMEDFVTALPRKNKRRSETDDSAGNATDKGPEESANDSTELGCKEEDQIQDQSDSKRPKRNAKKKVIE